MTKAEEKERDALALVRDEMQDWRERYVYDGLRTADVKALLSLIDRLDREIAKLKGTPTPLRSYTFYPKEESAERAP